MKSDIPSQFPIAADSGHSSVVSQRPQRWDEPFGPEMCDRQVAELLQYPPFRSMDPDDFTAALPLAGILKYDCRLLDLEDGDIVIREGDYGASAFLILNGEVSVALKSLPRKWLGRSDPRPRNWYQIVSQLWGNRKVPEARDAVKAAAGARISNSGRSRVFLQDIPRILGPEDLATLEAGDLFGELAALTRTPRTATVFSNGKSRLLEIRWQGLKELIKRSGQLREHTYQQYRQNSLLVHLRECPLFRGLDDAAMETIQQHVEFSTYGDFDWQNQFRNISKKELHSQVEKEPLVVSEGDYVDGLLLIRNGFGRVSHRYGDGHRTITYLGKGDHFGLPELRHALESGETQAWRYSLRAVGYLDTILVPTMILEQFVLPNLPSGEAEEPAWWGRIPSRQPTDSATEGDRLEILGQQRLINGQQAMMIDLERCTRCDDCVRACADAHDGNPRFLRNGPVVGHHMVAHACMHCLDPVCMIGCPTGAIGREVDSGVVQINDTTCIGCGTCSQSCPYQNIRMVEIYDRQHRQIVDDQSLPILKATKCDLCVEQMGGPACQHACPHDALVRLNMREVDVLSRWLDR